MKYNKLGNSDLNVSKICLGTMTWGIQNTELEAFEQLDFALDKGINFIDTAEIYPIPSREELHGITETYIGNWLNKRKNRDKIILATKVAGPAEFVKYVRGGPRLNKKQITTALDDSLKRLQTDYIDIYQVHWPERLTNYFGQLGFIPLLEKENDVIPILETLETLDKLVKIGKIKYIGISNETSWGVSQYLKHSENKNKARIVSIQNPYNLLNRSFEVGMSEFAMRENISLLAYSALGFGVLSGKYANDNKPENARLTLWGKRYGRYTNDEAKKATVLYLEIAKKYNLDPSQMSIAFVLSRVFLGACIIGATNLKQLETNIGSLDLELDKKILAEIDYVHKLHSNPAP